MSFGDDEYEMRHRRRNWSTILLPVMGFLLAGLAAIIAFALSAPATVFVRQRVSGVPEGEALQIAVGVGIFLIVMLVFAMFYAIFAPKPKAVDTVTERELEKEKKLREKEKIAQRKRRRQINQEMARQNREKNENR